MRCSLCHDDFLSDTITVPTRQQTPEGEQVAFEVCQKCHAIISAISGGDKYEEVMAASQNVIDIMLDVLVVLNQMLAHDLDYTHEQEPRKSVIEALESWEFLATQNHVIPVDRS
jgi:hypothetical protein